MCTSRSEVTAWVILSGFFRGNAHETENEQEAPGARKSFSPDLLRLYL
jgi:hypothetical protein